MTLRANYTFLILCLLLGTASCKNYVCPTYSGAFLLGIGHEDEYFSYFTKDSLPKEDGLMASREKTWYGLGKPRRYFQITGIVTGDKLGIGANYPKEIYMEARYPADTTVAAPDSVQLKETDLDDLFADAPILPEDDVTADTPDPTTQADSTATDGEFQIDDPELPPRNVEQYYYELMFREQLIEWLQSGPKPEEADSLAVDSLQANQKKWWQFWKKAPDTITEDQEDGTENKSTPPKTGIAGFFQRLFGGSKNQPKSEKEQKIEKIKEQQKKEKEEATEFDDW